MKIGDKVRISKNDYACKATKTKYKYDHRMNEYLGAVLAIKNIDGDRVILDTNINGLSIPWNWHIDDLTPLDPPSMALVQVGDVIKGEDGKYHFVYDTDNLKHQIFIISFLSNINGSLVSSEDETYDIANITAIYKGGNLDNIINQSVEGLELIWERAEEKPEHQQENHKVLEKIAKIEADLAEVKLMIKGQEE